jgi:hypothetical protein
MKARIRRWKGYMVFLMASLAGCNMQTKTSNMPNPGGATGGAQGNVSSQPGGASGSGVGANPTTGSGTAAGSTSR